ncbi:sigma-70 family RNA polymerase sigma factor [Cohnella cellulosilytica]|uniref:Sigma-70 family RNA polymerase sigma factor n=1 Tax=Cohnella cellulosilytica TaxID=986710 RepID=A0ABW2FBC3_9BACL
MEESILLKQLKQRRQSALEELIGLYGAYVSTIVRNVIGSRMKNEDVEEVVSDVFVLLWTHAERIRDDSTTIKSYLAAIARNQSLKKWREHHPHTYPLDDDILTAEISTNEWAELERRDWLEWALSLMSERDREIFIRYYFLMEKTAVIAEQLRMNESTVRSRLSRGRENLRQAIENGGLTDENKNIRNVRAD